MITTYKKGLTVFSAKSVVDFKELRIKTVESDSNLLAPDAWMYLLIADLQILIYLGKKDEG